MPTTLTRMSAAGLAVFAGLSPPAFAEEGAAAREWQGRYRYEHAAGRTAGGTGIVVIYDLSLGPPGTRGGCVLSMAGFQTDERLLCQAQREGDGLTVTFHRYPDGRTVNTYGVAVYRPGQPLFRLSRSEAGLVTRWQGLRPDGQAVPETGSFFVKAK
ncbi:DUF5991 domain-containing protein [Methylorubrum zatmanii]